MDGPDGSARRGSSKPHFEPAGRRRSRLAHSLFSQFLWDASPLAAARLVRSTKLKSFEKNDLCFSLCSASLPLLSVSSSCQSVTTAAATETTISPAEKEHSIVLLSAAVPFCAVNKAINFNKPRLSAAADRLAALSAFGRRFTSLASAAPSHSFTVTVG